LCDTATVSDQPSFNIPLNLPHAGRIARRLLTMLHRDGKAETAAGDIAVRLVALLDACYESEENPPPAEAGRLRDTAAELGRQFAVQVELDALGHDRLGQAVRNLFECLELGREGAVLSLRAGEDPNSIQRPR
jgi:hypothetical protein